MSKRGRKSHRTPVHIPDVLIKNDNQSNGINPLNMQIQPEMETAHNISLDDCTVPATTATQIRSSSNLSVSQSNDVVLTELTSVKICTENSQDTESPSYIDDNIEDCQFSVNNVANHAQQKFESEDIGVEIIVELDAASISRDQVNEYLSSFCNDEESYSDSNTSPKEIHEEVNNVMPSDGSNIEGVACDENDQLYICDVCQKGFPTKSKLQKHVLVHVVGAREKKLECKRCLRRFSYEAFMIRHKCGMPTQRVKKEIQESSESTYKCRVCSQEFETKYYLKKHVQSEGHQFNLFIEKPYACPECSRSYTKKSYLQTHKCKLYTCETCGLSFSDLAQLERHAMRHDGERKYMCAKCKKVYTSLPGLRYHEMNHTGERRYICSTCGKCFAMSSTLKIHQTCHAEQRPYPCAHPTCGKSFSVLSHLRMHELRHTGLRPHGCPHCNKHFTDIPNLKKHLKVHAEERPVYMCSLCDKQYISLRGLRDHQAQHSGEFLG